MDIPKISTSIASFSSDDTLANKEKTTAKIETPTSTTNVELKHKELLNETEKKIDNSDRIATLKYEIANNLHPIQNNSPEALANVADKILAFEADFNK